MKAILTELADILSPTQREAFAVFLEAELARRTGGDFDRTVRSMMGEAEWEKAISSIPRDLLHALFANAETSVATRH